MAVGVCVLLAGVLVCLECKEKRLRRESTQYYTFPLPRAFDYETVCTAIETASGVQWTYLCDETARICRIEGVFSWRVALLHQPEFSAPACKAQRDRANRAANRAHPSKQEGLQWEIASRARINLVVCDAVNDALSRYIGAHTQRMLSRNECHQHGGGGRSSAAAACPRRGCGFPLTEPLFLQRRSHLVAAASKFT